MKKLILITLIIFSVATWTTELSDIRLESIPDWVNLRHYKYHPPLNIRLLAKLENFTLRDAVEVQNHFYDMLDNRKNQSTEQKFAMALDRVKNSREKYENVWNGKVIAEARFIVVFDLDDTLLNQYYEIGCRGPQYWDMKIDEKRYNLIKFTPYWKETILRIKELGGAVVFFTAKKDYKAQKIYAKWMIGDKHISQVIDGFMTKNHLIMVPGENYDRGRAYPMKDLEIIDPDLQRAILIDDSPSKTYQASNIRFFHKYNPDIHLNEKTSPKIKVLYDNLLKEMLAEIEETLKYMKSHPKISFVHAYRPYSLMGRVTLNSLIATGLSRQQALKVIRENDKLIENRF